METSKPRDNNEDGYLGVVREERQVGLVLERVALEALLDFVLELGRLLERLQPRLEQNVALQNTISHGYS